MPFGDFLFEAKKAPQKIHKKEKKKSSRYLLRHVERNDVFMRSS